MNAGRGTDAVRAFSSSVFLSAITACSFPVPSAARKTTQAARSACKWAVMQTSTTTARLPARSTITFGDKSAEWTPEKLAALPHTTVTV